MKKVKVGIKKKDLRPRKTDFRFVWRDKDGGIHYEDANFRPESVDPNERVKLLPYTLEQVIELAERDKRKATGWKYFPRYSYRITFFYSYRRDLELHGDREPRNEFISQMTFSPYPTRTEVIGKGKFLDPNDAVYERYAEQQRNLFWSSFDSEMKRLELSKAEIEKLRKRIENEISSG